MNYWFLADTHFGHTNLLKHRPSFSTVEEMNEKLIENYNSVVKQGDMVYHLGDFSFNKKISESIFNRLNGQIHLVIGNHDGKDGKDVRKLKFNFMKTTYYFKIDGQKLVLSHFPYAIWDCKHHGAIHLHGHSHGGYKGEGKIMDVGVDCHNYFPINYDTVLAYMANKPTINYRDDLE